jgi:formylglycine-generating enzyme required for sulfatase activity
LGATNRWTPTGIGEYGRGGGASGCTLYNCTLTGNSAGWEGGGVAWSTLTNCIVYFNTATNGANYSSEYSTLNYCSTTPLPTNGVGNITNEPAFLNVAAGDYHLAFRSPCIDAGTNLNAILATDLDGAVPVWTSLPEQTDIQGSGGMDSLTDTNAAERRFYKVGVDVQPYYLRNMVWIPPGTFTMGSPETESGRNSNEGPQTQVTISRGFWMGKYEVTQGEYLEVVGNNPSYFRNGTMPHEGGTGGPVTNELLHPVETVSWSDATNYCALLTERERAAGRLPEGYVYRPPHRRGRDEALLPARTRGFPAGVAQGDAEDAGRWRAEAGKGGNAGNH